MGVPPSVPHFERVDQVLNENYSITPKTRAAFALLNREILPQVVRVRRRARGGRVLQQVVRARRAQLRVRGRGLRAARQPVPSVPRRLLQVTASCSFLLLKLSKDKDIVSLPGPNIGLVNFYHK